MVHARNAKRLTKEADEVQARLTEGSQRRAMEGARMKGGSLVLTTMPIAEHGFHLASKSDFHDFLKLHFGWPLPKLPATCPCGKSYSVDHAQMCKLGGFVGRRHDDLVDLLGRRMKQCYNDVEVEPLLQPLTGERFKHKTANKEDGAKSDLRVRGFWTDAKNAFFDVRVFYSNAPSYQSKSVESHCKSVALTKKREYEERILHVEHGSFTPLIFPSSGGMGAEATVVLKKLAAEIAVKRKDSVLQRGGSAAGRARLLAGAVDDTLRSRLSVSASRHGLGQEGARAGGSRDR
jgi:hypothetical protein